jgi:hypothetical protein
VGKIAMVPLLARTGARLTPEGGADVPTDWAASPVAHALGSEDHPQDS